MATIGVPTVAGADRRWTTIRAGLAVLGLGQGAAALLALAAPRTFFDDFPVRGAHWVSSFAPYNEHLVRDYGASFAAIAALALIAAWVAERRLVRIALVVWLVAAVPHFVFHLAHADMPSGFSGAASLATLAFNIVAPLVLLALVPKENR
jgi:hypothetical protein